MKPPGSSIRQPLSVAGVTRSLAPPALTVRYTQTVLSLAHRVPLLDDSSILNDLVERSVNAFGIVVPTYGVDALFLKTKQCVSSVGLRNTCFVDAVVQLLFRVEPLHEALIKHVCDIGPIGCVLCCARDQSMALRGQVCLPYPGCPLAVLTRRGHFGREFALDIVEEGGKLKGVEPMCDAAEFMIVLLERLGVEECALEDFKSDTSRSILYELLVTL